MEDKDEDPKEDMPKILELFYQVGFNPKIFSEQYGNILIIYDEDKDQRVKSIIDMLGNFKRKRIIAVYEHEAVFSMIVSCKFPFAVLPHSIYPGDGDIWNFGDIEMLPSNIYYEENDEYKN